MKEGNIYKLQGHGIVKTQNNFESTLTKDFTQGYFHSGPEGHLDQLGSRHKT